MRAALIIGISEYEQDEADLPGCSDDAKAVEVMVRGAGRFDKIEMLVENTKGVTLKARMTQFFRDLENEDVEEFFFYYTGHGGFSNDEFYYQLSDYSVSKRNQTSIQNNELDGLIRNVNPKLTVKIVDACQSGVQYIKDTDSVEKYLKKATGGYSNCYFMFSSHSDESSYQNENELSYFTKSLVEGVVNHDGGSLRYKDIIDYISDDFQSKAISQTPFFVMQAKNTEVFTDVTDKLKEDLKFFLSTGTLPLADESKITSVASSLVELIKADSLTYCNEGQLDEALEKLKVSMKNYSFSEEFNSLYTVQTSFGDQNMEQIPLTKEIGEWIDESGGSYFAEVVWQMESYQANVTTTKASPFGSAFQRMMQPETKTVTRERRVVSGYRLTKEVDYEVIILNLEPKHQNIPPYKVYIPIVFSKQKLRSFINIVQLKELNWSDRTIGKHTKWITEAVDYVSSEAVIKWIASRISKVESQVLDPLRVKYLPKKSEYKDLEIEGEA